jgi:hypothetical protein
MNPKGRLRRSGAESDSLGDKAGQVRAGMGEAERDLAARMCSGVEGPGGGVRAVRVRRRGGRSWWSTDSGKDWDRPCERRPQATSQAIKSGLAQS